MRWLVVLLLAWSGLATADTTKQRAEKLFDDGRKYLAAGEYALACEAFEQSQAADAAVGTQLNIALCYEQWGKLATAYKAYEAAEHAASTNKDARAKVARDKRKGLVGKVAMVEIVVPPQADAYALYRLDDVEIERAALSSEHVLDPGRHVIEVRVSGAPPVSTEFVAGAGERQTVEVELPQVEVAVPRAPATAISPDGAGSRASSRRSAPRLYGGLALLAIGVVAMGGAGYVALDARSDYNAAAERCPGGACTTRADYDATRDARSRARAMTYVFGGGVAVAIIGTYLLATSERPVAREHITIMPAVDNNNVGVVIGGSL